MAADPPPIAITVCYSPQARQVVEYPQQLPAGTTVAQWLANAECPPGHAPHTTLALWGRPAEPNHVLRDGDRLEWLRPLTVDPKVARRERFKGQGAKTAGLFASRRPGAKSGY